MTSAMGREPLPALNMFPTACGCELGDEKLTMEITAFATARYLRTSTCMRFSSTGKARGP